jgi:hypothetical protein
MENQRLGSTSRQCSSTPIGFDQKFLSKVQCDYTVVSPTPHVLAPTDFYLFSSLKSALKGRRFRYATEKIKNAVEELKRLSQNGFQVHVLHVYNLLQKCLVAQEK